LTLIDQALQYTFIIGVGLAFILFLRYLYVERQAIDLTKTITLILSCQGIVGGPALCYKALIYSTWQVHSNETLYIFIGGIAMLWEGSKFVSSLLAISWKPKGKHPED
jgi:hypothetical protein